MELLWFLLFSYCSFLPATNTAAGVHITANSSFVCVYYTFYTFYITDVRTRVLLSALLREGPNRRWQACPGARKAQPTSRCLRGALSAKRIASRSNSKNPRSAAAIRVRYCAMHDEPLSGIHKHTSRCTSFDSCTKKTPRNLVEERRRGGISFCPKTKTSHKPVPAADTLAEATPSWSQAGILAPGLSDPFELRVSSFCPPSHRMLHASDSGIVRQS